MTGSDMTVSSLVLLSASVLLAPPSPQVQELTPTRVVRRMDLPVQLGPTGLSGYVFRSGIVVSAVQPRSPADGKVELGDLIQGAGGERFADGSDPRRALGAAITAAEAGSGLLELEVLRGSRTKTLRVRVEKLGAYAPTWPEGCAKSERILREAGQYLLRHQESAVIRPHAVVRGSNGLLLLALGEPEHMELARRAAYRIADDPLTAGYQGWSRSYSGIFLAEYYLRTKDPIVLPKLRELARTIPAGQMACGSWGHRMPFDGYGAVNQIGLACWLAMILIEDCGIEVDPEAMQRSARFFGSFAGKGWIPYGDHTPWRGNSGNGKNAIAAVAFDLLGGHAEETAEFGRTTAASFEHREEGHTGAFFSFLWGPLGAMRASQGELRGFLDGQSWYYDLARTHDGGIVCQPNPENLSGRTPGTYTQWGANGTTGAMAWPYALHTKRLRILGGEPEGVSMRDLDAWAKRAIRQDVRRGDFFLAKARLTALQRSAGQLPRGLSRVARSIEESEGRRSRRGTGVLPGDPLTRTSTSARGDGSRSWPSSAMATTPSRREPR